MPLLAIAYLAVTMRCNPLERWSYKDKSDYVRLVAIILRDRI